MTAREVANLHFVPQAGLFMSAAAAQQEVEASPVVVPALRLAGSRKSKSSQ